MVSLTTIQKTEITNHINMYRIKNQVDKLVYDDTISLFSQN